MTRLIVLAPGIVTGLLLFAQVAVAGPPSSVAQYVEMVPTATGSQVPDDSASRSTSHTSTGSQVTPVQPATTPSATTTTTTTTTTTAKRTPVRPRVRTHPPPLTTPASTRPTTSFGSVTADWWPVSVLLGAVFAGGIGVRLKLPR